MNRPYLWAARVCLLIGAIGAGILMRNGWVAAGLVILAAIVVVGVLGERENQ